MIAPAVTSRPKRRGHRVPHYLPTPAEIARQCAEIRKEWSPREMASRAGQVKIRQWVVPSVRVHTEHTLWED